MEITGGARVFDDLFARLTSCSAYAVRSLLITTASSQARSASGKLIPNLSQADFQIFENNIEQQVVRFEPVTSAVSVVLLLDASGSTKEHWKIIKKAAKKFIETLSPNTPQNAWQ
jgi:hypothetical protein